MGSIQIWKLMGSSRILRDCHFLPVGGLEQSRLYYMPAPTLLFAVPRPFAASRFVDAPIAVSLPCPREEDCAVAASAALGLVDGENH